MNGTNIAPRAFSFILAALITTILMAGIDTLATTEHAANALLAQTAKSAAQPT